MTQSYPISASGLLLDVMVGLPGKSMAPLVGAGEPVPAPIKSRALIDSGTDVTCIASSPLRGFGLNPVANRTSRTLSGSVFVDLFEVSFSLPGPTPGLLLVLPQLVVIEMRSPPPDINVLVGMDVLLQCVLHVDGPQRQFTVST